MSDLVPGWHDRTEQVPSLIRSMQQYGIVYVSGPNIGPCQRCGFVDDRRVGVCFECSGYVAGRLLGEGVHLLWDTTNPRNQWMVWVQP